MKYLIAVFVLFLSAGAQAQLEWLSFEQAVERSKEEPRKMLIDVYTDWCGWCKKMDKAVFAQPEIADYISENFYAVKLNAEQREDIQYDGHTFKFDPSSGRRGSHQLAAILLDGRLSFPSIVYLDEKRDRITISPGFKPADKYIRELSYIKGEHYKTQQYQEYLSEGGK